MYVPYLYGRQHELQAIEKLAPEISISAAAGKVVIPLFEPVKLSSVWKRLIPRIEDTGISYFIVLNPQVGKLVGKQGEVVSETFGNDPNALPGAIPTYILTANTTAADVGAFAQTYASRDVALVVSSWNANAGAIGTMLASLPNVKHVLFTGSGVNPSIKQQLSPAGGVMITDGFDRVPRNADYPPTSFFSDAHQTYQALGYTGFGDYLMVGKDYKEGGGPAAAVALHLTEKDMSGVLMMRHFVSIQKQGQGVDTEGKFLEALAQLVSYVQGPPRRFQYSRACDAYIDLHQRQHFPQLGIPKELSMRHHVALILNEVL